MKCHEPNPLLKEILAGDELADFRQASLEQGLSALRWRQRRQRVIRLGAVLILPLLFTVGILFRRSPEASPQHLASTNSARAAIPTTPAEDHVTKFITDDELFALFPNRPLALVGKPGQQQLVFLDQATASRRP